MYGTSHIPDDGKNQNPQLYGTNSDNILSGWRRSLHHEVHFGRNSCVNVRKIVLQSVGLKFMLDH
jgi:hypothetical protein